MAEEKKSSSKAKTEDTIVVDKVEVSTKKPQNQKKKRKPLPKDSINGLIISIVEIVVGILLLIKPVEFTKGIIITIGVIVTLIGFIDIVDYFRTPAEIAASERTLVTGIIMMIIGLFCAFNSNWFISTFPALTVIYGVIILIVGLSSIEDMIDMIRLKRKHWFVPCILGVLAIVFACIIFANPFASTSALWTFVAISIIIEAVIEIISVCVKYFKSNNRKK